MEGTLVHGERAPDFFLSRWGACKTCQGRVLLCYARIARPHFAFLIAPQGANRSLTHLLTVYRRLDVLEYFAEQGRLPRALIVARWDAHGGTIAFDSIVTTDAQKVELGKF
ncbi:MAG: hypothetical protein KJ047_12210 [Anaerolineae bacterium]|nr:hypothetical protein [Anaerolineae bacterium]